MPGRFDQGSMFQSVYLEYFDSQDSDRDIWTSQLNTDVGYYLLKDLAVIGNLALFAANGNRFLDSDPTMTPMDADTFGGGFGGMLHLDVITIDSWSLFLDAGVGMLFTTDDFPPRGTAWNFKYRYGFGIAAPLDDNLNLIAGFRRLHISNGKGIVPGNPSYDGNGGYFGLLWQF